MNHLQKIDRWLKNNSKKIQKSGIHEAALNYLLEKRKILSIQMDEYLLTIEHKQNMFAVKKRMVDILQLFRMKKWKLLFAAMKLKTWNIYTFGMMELNKLIWKYTFLKHQTTNRSITIIEQNLKARENIQSKKLI